MPSALGSAAEALVIDDLDLTESGLSQRLLELGHVSDHDDRRAVGVDMPLRGGQSSGGEEKNEKSAARASSGLF
jgi:hypothetical protein